MGLGLEMSQAIQCSKVLVVGAGGIGCELLKNLVLTSFLNIHIVDLDTIDVSNLNRQFLFRRHHVGKSKAMVAKEAVMRFNQAVSIFAHHANIKDEQFGAAFFSQFDIVLNALDNVDARRHVNRLCLALDIPLIESGTEGYIGQTTTVRRGFTECFECQPKAASQTFAVCTIRNTPDQPVHCIVWAKYVLSMLFGPPDADNIMLDKDLGGESYLDGSGNFTESDFLSTQLYTGSPTEMANLIFKRYFTTDIEKAILIADRWVNRPAPIPLYFDELLKSHNEVSDCEKGLQDQHVPTVSECATAVIESLCRIYKERSHSIGSISFDKDDDLLMDCVAHLANLRMFVFHIPMQSRFHIKGIAGNIVHAIASTNAIAAGLIVLEAIKVISKEFGKCRTVWIGRCGPKLLLSQRLEEPNKSCFVCSKSKRLLAVNCDVMALTQLFKVCRDVFGMNTPSIDVVSHENFIGCEDDHGDSDYLSRALSDPGVRIVDGAVLVIDDLSQRLEIELLVQNRFDVEGFEVLQTNAVNNTAKKRPREESGHSDGMQTQL
uniref:SUMO-activating enzyme subunit n=1 Tax=Spongospora subterranea TaxID=70186 RepID=A0A0H5RMU5_9EUKA|eukprot:CRZ10054.1 hypothetical protein [Spongospora subterranea]